MPQVYKSYQLSCFKDDSYRKQTYSCFSQTCFKIKSYSFFKTPGMAQWRIYIYILCIYICIYLYLYTYHVHCPTTDDLKANCTSPWVVLLNLPQLKRNSTAPDVCEAWHTTFLVERSTNQKDLDASGFIKLIQVCELNMSFLSDDSQGLPCTVLTPSNGYLCSVRDPHLSANTVDKTSNS